MNLNELLYKKIEALPDEKKIEVIEFIDFLNYKKTIKLNHLMDQIIDDNEEALRELGK